MSGTEVSNFGKPGTDTSLSDGIGDEEISGYAVFAPVEAMFFVSQYRFCQLAPAGLVRNCWNSPKSRTVLPAACAPVQRKPARWWPSASSSVSYLRTYSPAEPSVYSGSSACISQ